MHTIGYVAKQFQISRSTLLYYDKIGLLTPSERTPAGYRVYSNADIERMKKITLYKKIGIDLKEIAILLDNKETSLSLTLEERLSTINCEISKLREQQQFILSLLGDDLIYQTKIMNKEQWVKILKDSGMNEIDMMRWHAEFERNLPNVHHDFLQSLGIENIEINKIRERARNF